MLAITTKINEIIKDILGVNDLELKETIPLDEIGLDSIEKAEMLVKLQKSFSVKLNLEEFQSLNTMSEIYQYVEIKLQ